MVAGQIMKLNESIPLDEEDLGAMALAIMISSTLYGLLVWWGSIGSTSPTPIWMFGPGMFLLLSMFNLTPISRLPGKLQYLFAVVVTFFMHVLTHPINFVGDFLAAIFIAFFVGFFLFTGVRVNWWFLWQNTSARTRNEKFLTSIIFTVLFPLGMVMGMWRLWGVGRNEATTEYVSGVGGIFEVLPENPELAQHKARREAIAAGGRITALNKDEVSGTL